MADKKITQLTELTQIGQDDLFVVVSAPASTPITKSIKANKLFGSINYTTSSGTPTKSLVNSVLTVAVNATGTVTAGQFVTDAQSGSSNTQYQYGVVVTSALSSAAANVAVQHAAGKFVLDVSNSTCLLTNTYVGLFHVANTGTRTANVEAFIGIGDAAANSTTAQTKYLFDIGLNATANVSRGANGANTTTLLSNTSNGGTVAATHKLRVRVNGQDYFILLANATATNL